MNKIPYFVTQKYKFENYVFETHLFHVFRCNIENGSNNSNLKNLYNSL